MKFPLLAPAALLLFPIALSAAEPSPVGTWEVSLAGADHGLAYVTFEDDQEFSGYGVTRGSTGLFTLSGTWTVDESGNLNGSYTELISGETVTGALSGKVSATKISGKIAATNGNFSFKAKPEAGTQDLSGSWTGIAVLGNLRLPEIYQITPHLLPHVFEVSGTGFSPAGEFSISGTAIAGSGGKLQLFATSQAPGGNPGFSNLSGTVTGSRKQNVLKGFEATGQPIKISLRR